MSPEPTIIDTSVIQVKSTTLDSYGNLIVTPEVGEDVRIGAKRNSLFDIFQQDRAVKLYWAEYQHRKYVARAELFDGKPPEEKRIEPITTNSPISPSPESHKKFIAPEEKGMWWKELGEMLRAGDIDKTKPAGKFLRDAYYAQMFSVLDITVESTHKESS